MRLLLTLVIVVLMNTGAFTRAMGQTVGQNKGSGAETYTLSVRTQLVVEAVTVRDKQGNAVLGLTPNDFSLTQDGIPQKIRFCEHQALPTSATTMPATPSREEEITVYKRLTRTQLAPENPESLRYKDRRLLALYFDMT